MKFKIIMQTAYFAFNDNLKDFRDSDWLIAVQTFSVENIPEKKVMRLNYAEHYMKYIPVQGQPCTFYEIYTLTGTTL